MPDVMPSASYLSLTKAENGEFSDFKFATTLEEARSEVSEQSPVTDASIVDTSQTVNPNHSKATQLSELMVKFANSAFSFHPLVLVGSATKQLMIRAYIRNALAGAINKDSPADFEDDKQIIYGLDEPTAAALNPRLERFWVLEKGMATLPSATLLAMVASFDSMFAETARYFLKLNPKRFETDDFKVSVADAIRAGSVDKMVDKIIQNEVFELMRGSHHEQTEFIRDKLDVDIPVHWKRYSDFIEIFERRNLVAHGESRYTDRYVQKCQQHGNPERMGELGKSVGLGPGYLRNAADILLEYGILLIFSLWRKHARDLEEGAFDWANIAALKAIAEGRNKAATRILSYTLSIKTTKFSDKSRKMQRVNLANAYFKLKDAKTAEQVLSEEDWSAVSDDFMICISAIRGDVDKVIAQMKGVVERRLVRSEDFREWPAFERIRHDERFTSEYRAIFGQPLIPAQLNVKSASIEAEDAEAEDN